MGKPPGRSGSFKQATREIEAEVKKVLDFVEERMVPRARRDGEKMLRRLAEEMNHWADHLHDPPAPNPPPGATKK
jgi:hypothetical protein